MSTEKTIIARCFDGIVEAIAVIGHSCDDPIKLHMDGIVQNGCFIFLTKNILLVSLRILRKC